MGSQHTELEVITDTIRILNQLLGFWKLRPEVDKTMSMDVNSSDEEEKSNEAEKTLFHLLHTITQTPVKKEHIKMELPQLTNQNQLNPKLPEKDNFTLPPIGLPLAPDFSADFEKFIHKYGIKPQRL